MEEATKVNADVGCALSQYPQQQAGAPGMEDTGLEPLLCYLIYPIHHLCVISQRN